MIDWGAVFNWVMVTIVVAIGLVVVAWEALYLYGRRRTSVDRRLGIVPPRYLKDEDGTMLKSDHDMALRAKSRRSAELKRMVNGSMPSRQSEKEPLHRVK